MAAIVNFCLFLVLVSAGTTIVIAAPVAFFVAAMVNYLLSISILFRHQARWRTTTELIKATRLFEADLFPICAPALAGQLKKPADLVRLPLLRVTSAPDDWSIWLKAAGLRGLQAKGPRFDYDAFALQAAIDGLGVALAHRPYVADDLAAGRLVMPFDIVAARGQGWYLVHRNIATNGAEHAPLALFRDWLLKQAAGERQSSQRRSLTRREAAVRVRNKAAPGSIRARTGGTK